MTNSGRVVVNEWAAVQASASRLWFQPMPVFRKLITVVSVGVLGLFAIYAVSTPFLREPPTPVVNFTIEPQPLPDASKPPSGNDGEDEEPSSETTDEPLTAEPEPTSPAYQTGERTGEKLNELWSEIKDFGRGLWSTITEKEC